MHVQLTISLLVSNRIPAIRRCLDSLVPILMQVPSELIIVDTSENERIRELALQYTSHVIPFRWCNDFSKARNAGLQAAKGEWFMFIDDDEWLEDPSEIIGFFLSGEHQNYNSATYTQRNYMEWTGRVYLDAYVGRMVRRTPETRFVSTIHEYLTPYKVPVKRFSTYVHHYGYADNVVDAKTDRNIPLLKKELQEDRVTVHNYIQLCQEYLSVCKYAEAEIYAVKCLELEEPDKEKEKSWCLAYLPHLVHWQGDHERALEIGKQSLRHPLCTGIAALFIYTVLIAVCEALGDHEKDIIVYGKNYHWGLSRLDARPEQWFLQSIGGLGEQQIKSVKNKVCMSGFQAAVRIRDTRSAKTFLQWFPWEDKEIENLYPFFYTLLQDEGNRDFILSRFAALEVEDPFVFLIKAEAAWNEGDAGLAQEYNRAAVSGSSILVRWEAVYLCLQSQGRLSLDPWMGCMDIHQWADVSQRVAGKAKISELAAWIKTMEAYLPEFPVQALSVLIVLQEKFLVEGVLEIEDRDMVPKMEQYCGWVQQYVSLVYNEDLLFPENRDLLPGNCRFALQMEQVFQDMRRADHSGVLQGLRQAVNIYAPLCGAVRRMLPVIETEMGKSIQANGEFEMLGAQVKKMVQELIWKNCYKEALPLLQQLTSLLPGDLEVLRMRQEVWAYSE